MSPDEHRTVLRRGRQVGTRKTDVGRERDVANPVGVARQLFDVHPAVEFGAIMSSGARGKKHNSIRTCPQETHFQTGATHLNSQILTVLSHPALANRLTLATSSCAGALGLGPCEGAA